jgi:hypothetical protein
VPCSSRTSRARTNIHLLLRLKTIRQKQDESLWDYVKCFYNARNAISYIQNIEIINSFHDGVSDIKTMEEIIMKKLKTVTDLNAVTVTVG